MNVLPSGTYGDLSRVSLPSAFGILPDYETEWWYFVGHAVDTVGRTYSLYFEALRRSFLSTDLTLGMIAVGRAGSFHSRNSPGIGTSVDNQYASLYVSPPSNKSFQLIGNWENMSIQFEYVSGPGLGLDGSTYRLTFNDAITGISGQLLLQDERGTVLEGKNGFIPSIDVGSYEWANPRLNIISGSMVYEEESITFSTGNIWFDRQFLDREKSDGSDWSVDVVQSTRLGRAAATPLYTGTWMALFFMNGVSATTASFWKPHSDQWLSGRKIKNPPLCNSFGTLYYPSEIEGTRIAALTPSDFSVDILSPHHPECSPHYTSPVSGKTYSTAWQLELPCGTFYMFAVVDEAELTFFDIPETGFWEGACYIYADKHRKKLVGYGFVEQMGFNQ